MVEQTLKEKTAKGLFWGGLNGGIQQILNVVFGVFLARLLSPVDYGLVGMLGIFMGIATVLFDSGFGLALINRKEIRHDDYNSVFWFSLSVGLICYVILFFSAPLIAIFFDRPELESLSRVLFLWFLIGSTTVAPNALMLKKMMFKERAKIDICAMIVSGVVGVILAFKGFAYWGIVVQTVTNSLVGATLRWYYVPWHPNLTFKVTPLKEMYTFGVKVFFTNIFTQINANVFSVLLGRFYRPEQVGYYTQGNKWMNMGYSFIWNMIGGVSLPVLTEVASDVERQQKVFRKILRFVSFVSFPSMLGLAFVAPELIVIGVSDKWLPCVPVMQLLCVWGAVAPIANLYSHVLLSHGKSDLYLYNTVALGVLQLLIIISVLSLGIYYMVLAFVIVNILWLLVWHYFVAKQIQIRLVDVFKDIFPFFLLSVGALGICDVLIQFLSVNNLYQLFILKILIVFVLYINMLYFLDVIIFKEILSLFKGRLINR